MTIAPDADLDMGQRWLENLSPGDIVPTMDLPLTLQRLVMEAGVNRDFTPLHHDHEDTRRTGAPAAYANTIFIQAFLEATLRSWMGHRGWLEELSIKMVSFNLADTVITAGGTVKQIDIGSGAQGTATVEMWMRSDEVLTVTGTAIVRLPVSAAHFECPQPNDFHTSDGEA